MRERKRMSVRVKSESTEKRKKRPLLIVMRAGAERMEHLRAAFSLMMMMMIWLGSFLRLLSKVFQKGSLASELSILSSTFQCARVFVVLKQCTGGGGGERLR